MPAHVEAYLRRVEGFAAGFHNDPEDSGGDTNKGITGETYAMAKTLGIVPVAGRLADLSDAQAFRIYQRLYWEASRACEMPDALAWVHVDGWIQHRPNIAAECLQRALGVPDDGVMGPMTMAAARTCGGDGLGAARRLVEERRAFYKRLIAKKPSQKKWEHGWSNRLDILSADVQARFGEWS